ncbi:hypothetical protein BDV59DRAFT_174953 [Aspergillus ambiguus]|uniref:uncharacterized protein n=1 Tax=Aspergillus ambiguus TaxID=176160 RepID=UPI003CCCE6C3
MGHSAKITKCVEGLHNKAFILKMDNGSKVLAKLPNPNAGPAHFSVASEVATRELLRDVFNIPLSRVLSWSSDAAKAVLPVDGMVEPEDYNLAGENNRKFKDTFLRLAKDEEEKELFGNLWPCSESGNI